MPLGRGCRPRGRHEPAEARSRLGERERVPGLVSLGGRSARLAFALHRVCVPTDDRPFSVEQLPAALPGSSARLMRARCTDRVPGFVRGRKARLALHYCVPTGLSTGVVVTGSSARF